jgi:hypothetical protein
MNIKFSREILLLFKHLMNRGQLEKENVNQYFRIQERSQTLKL